jgi:hypothetical protein
MSLAVVWHYWIGVVLLIATLGMIAAIAVGYFATVVRPKHPPKR